MLLNQQKKLLTKSEKEFQSSVMQVVNKLTATKGCLKGYGKEDRLMSGEHSPIENINHKITECLKFNSLIVQEGLIFIPTLKAHTIKLDDILLEPKL